MLDRASMDEIVAHVLKQIQSDGATRTPLPNLDPDKISGVSAEAVYRFRFTRSSRSATGD